jgi:peptide deformylase
MNMHGEPVLIEGSELLARVLQHETDHLDGIVFIDRLSAENRKQAMRDIRESDWFSENQVAGKQIQFKVSPHSTNGLGM